MSVRTNMHLLLVLHHYTTWLTLNNLHHFVIQSQMELKPNVTCPNLFFSALHQQQAFFGVLIGSKGCVYPLGVAIHVAISLVLVLVLQYSIEKALLMTNQNLLIKTW